MRVNAEMAGLRQALRYHSDRVLSVVDDEVKAATDGLKADLRTQTEDALGTRVANAWRGKYFANEGSASGPAAFVWSKAPRILDFFSSSKLVTPLGQAFAIPTENVPRGSRGRRLTPIEVEARFNAELQPVRLKSGKIGLFLDLVAARSKRRPGLRPATRGRLAQGRASRKLLMFVLWKGPLRGKALIDLDATAQKWGARTADNIGRRLGEEE
jgi:hypothetical protein